LVDYSSGLINQLTSTLTVHSVALNTIGSHFGQSAEELLGRPRVDQALHSRRQQRYIEVDQETNGIAGQL
jgi:hypothetical protein